MERKLDARLVSTFLLNMSIFSNIPYFYFNCNMYYVPSVIIVIDVMYFLFSFQILCDIVWHCASMWIHRTLVTVILLGNEIALLGNEIIVSCGLPFPFSAGYINTLSDIVSTDWTVRIHLSDIDGNAQLSISSHKYGRNNSSKKRCCSLVIFMALHSKYS